MKKNITIIDYGSGNILSAKQSFARVIKEQNIDAIIKWEYAPLPSSSSQNWVILS